ncbi:MAG TPA: hypothetical protein VFO16_01555 [Pseudonocardiaceae bacterium]|nr:hypothetical protein [Pseudonocardiaceae bacterium]
MTEPVTTAATPEQTAAAEAAEARLQALLKLGDVSQANAATGIVGDSGTGKTTLSATAVKYCWDRYHKISRYVAADPGGFGNMLLRMVRLGFAQVYNPINHVEPFETMEKLTLGYWPEKIDDPFTGYAQPDVFLVPPKEQRWIVYCPQGHEVRTLRSAAGLHNFSIQCPVCKGSPVTAQTYKVETITVQSPWIKHVGLYIFDSGTALCDWAMEDMAARAARNDPGAKDGNALSGTGARIISGEFAFGANTMQHYGFAQNRMRSWIKNTRTIPGQVMPPIWTFLELRATDDNKSIAVFGPKISGNARTAEVPSWLGNCLNTTKETNEKGKLVHRLYLVNHTDPGSFVPHLAKTRAEPGDLPPFLEDGEKEPPFTRFSLGYFFDQLEAALDRNTRLDAEAYPDAPAFHPITVDGEMDVVARKELSASQLGAGRGPVRTPLSSPAAVAAKAAGAATPAAATPPMAGGPSSGAGPRPVPPVVMPPAVMPPAVMPPAVATPTTPTPAAAPAPVTATPAAAPQTAHGEAPPPPVRPPTPSAIRPVVRAIRQAGMPPPPGGKK